LAKISYREFTTFLSSVVSSEHKVFNQVLQQNNMT